MRKGIVILIVALFCCGFIPRHKAVREQAPRKSITELYTEAIKSVTIRKDTINALGAIEAIFQQDSNYAPALNLLSRITRRPKNAVEYAERAYKSDTTNRYYLEDYARALINAEEYDRSIPVFERIVRYSTEPNDFRILAILFDNKNRCKEALAVLDSANVRFGRIPELGRLRQFCLLKLGKTLEAEVEAKRAVEEAPYLAQNHISLAKLYALTHRDSLAVKSYIKAIRLDSLEIWPWMEFFDYGEKRERKELCLMIMQHLFKYDHFPLKEKIAKWKTFSKDYDSYSKYYGRYDDLAKTLFIRHPDNREVNQIYCSHLYVSGQKEQALNFMKQYLRQQKEPKIGDFSDVISIESDFGRLDSVAHYTNLALKHFPQNIELLQLRSYVAQEHKKYEEALDWMKEALKYASKDEERGGIWASIGIIENQRGDKKRCYKAYEKALKYNPENSTVLNNLAYEYSLEGRNLNKALEMVERALELSANNPTFLDTKAWVLYKLGRYAEAKKVMQYAISLDRSKSPEYALHYGDILHALGEEFMAKTYWRKALERGADKEEIERRFLPQTEKKK